MSLFNKVEPICPACGTATAFEMVHSVNADRRPDLRVEILNGVFQRIACPGCGEGYRIEPLFTMVNVAKGEYLAVWPTTDLKHWAEIEGRSAAAFDRAYGADASGVAADIGRELKPRIAFGWEAAREKLLLRDLDINDDTIELAKIALVRTQDDLAVGPQGALRLIAADDERNLVFGLFPTGETTPSEELRVPAALLDEIDAESEWAALRERLNAGLFVDMLRLIVEPTPAIAAAA